MDFVELYKCYQVVDDCTLNSKRTLYIYVPRFIYYDIFLRVSYPSKYKKAITVAVYEFESFGLSIPLSEKSGTDLGFQVRRGWK